MSLMFASGNAGASQTERTFHCSYSKCKSKQSHFFWYFFAACWIQISSKRQREKKGWEGSFMVTKLFIKSPVPGIDREWGRWTKEGDHRVVMSPESCINRHTRWTKKNMAAQVRWGLEREHPQVSPCCPFQSLFSRPAVIHPLSQVPQSLEKSAWRLKGWLHVISDFMYFDFTLKVLSLHIFTFYCSWNPRFSTGHPPLFDFVIHYGF